ncbi:hypothetical protein AXG93_2374s1060 [Marchantia polymorpha subsp. ruderalis]|uniref:Uncharacterized protein n=1 Tax=Marchantia polymorpha subsp. ruderalis TaxID=1480154 RepID=A0A176WJP7_MARPO|nr:hypothetical protein AXG93_2374s1060 [Marchantia polymorpha subsp. ruderalis]
MQPPGAKSVTLPWSGERQPGPERRERWPDAGAVAYVGRPTGSPYGGRGAEKGAGERRSPLNTPTPNPNPVREAREHARGARDGCPPLGEGKPSSASKVVAGLGRSEGMAGARIQDRTNHRRIVRIGGLSKQRSMHDDDYDEEDEDEDADDDDR